MVWANSVIPMDATCCCCCCSCCCAFVSVMCQEYLRHPMYGGLLMASLGLAAVKASSHQYLRSTAYFHMARHILSQHKLHAASSPTHALHNPPNTPYVNISQLAQHIIAHRIASFTRANPLSTKSPNTQTLHINRSQYSPPSARAQLTRPSLDHFLADVC